MGLDVRVDRLPAIAVDSYFQYAAGKIRKKTSFEVINLSINQTISRTLVTSLTTLLVLIALYSFGGEVIEAFALALIIGVIVGTYSSIYVASASALALGITRSDLLIPEKEGVEADANP